MGRLKYFSSILILVSFLFGCAHPTKSIPRDIASLNASGGMVGIWFLQGTSSTRGPYNGELELRPASDGTFDVIRMVTYINYFYDGLRVQEVWSGKAVADTDTLTVTYDLQQGDFVTKIDGITKTAQELKTPVTINMRFFPSTSGLTAKFSDKRSSEYSEWVTTKRALEAMPLWKDERVFINAQGSALPPKERQSVRNAQKILNYAKDPFVQAYKNSANFKSEMPTIVVDRTDLEFYKNNNDVIRLVNKITDDATISESILKRNAYFPSLKDKAVRYDDSTVARNFTASNLIVVRKGESEQSMAPDVLDTDAAFTTGMYLASQAMRFQITKQEPAAVNVRRALRGLRNLAEVSRNSRSFASAIAPLPADQKMADTWEQGKETYQQFMWSSSNQENTLLGVLHGLTWAALSIPQTDIDAWNNIREIVKILNYKDQNFSSLSPSSRSTLGGLTVLTLGDQLGNAIFESYHPPKPSFYWAGNTDWKMEFQNLIESMNQLQLSIALNNAAKTAEWKKYLLEEFRIFAPAQRPLRAFVTYVFANSSGQEMQNALVSATQVLAEVPYPRSRMALNIDHSGDSSWTISPIPKNYWLVKEKNRLAVQNYYQGLQQLPIFELQGFTSRFIWKDDSFQYSGTTPKDTEATGVDYLYGYWLARFAGVNDVQ